VLKVQFDRTCLHIGEASANFAGSNNILSASETQTQEQLLKFIWTNQLACE